MICTTTSWRRHRPPPPPLRRRQPRRLLTVELDSLDVVYFVLVCPSGWTLYTSNNFCYFLNTNPLSFDDAEDFCTMTPGAHLASITDMSEQDFVYCKLFYQVEVCTMETNCFFTARFRSRS